MIIVCVRVRRIAHHCGAVDVVGLAGVFQVVVGICRGVIVVYLEERVFVVLDVVLARLV